jgi:hypothetical protein
MNHRKKMQAKGIRRSANATRLSVLVVQADTSVESAGTESRIITTATPNNTANSMPATAPARGAVTTWATLEVADVVMLDVVMLVTPWLLQTADQRRALQLLVSWLFSRTTSID